MSRSTLATRRLARSRPPSKIGTRTTGTKLQVCVPPPNRLERSSLAVPTAPVSVMEGKNAARAAPMLALAACRACSACSTSGRRSRTSEGRPAGSAPSPLTDSPEPVGSSAASIGAPTSTVRAWVSWATWPA